MNKEEKLKLGDKIDKAMVKLAKNKSNSAEEALLRLTLNEEYRRLLKRQAETSREK